MKKKKEQWMNRQKEYIEWMSEWMNEWMNGQKNEWTDGENSNQWMNIQTEKR